MFLEPQSRRQGCQACPATHSAAHGASTSMSFGPRACSVLTAPPNCLSCCALPCHSLVSDSATAWTVAHQAPLSMGILQARALEGVAFPSSRGSSQPRNGTQISRIAGRFFTRGATREILFYLSFFKKIIRKNEYHENEHITINPA